MKSIQLFIAVLSLAVVSIIAGCSRPDRVIDNTQDEWEIVAATDASPSSLTLLHQPDGIVTSSNIYSNVNGGPLPGTITKIIEFRENLYLLIPSVYQIIVVNKDSYKKVSTIDLSVSQRIPSDIAFGNATTGYIAHENDTTVSVLDITNFTIPRSITVGKHPIAIVSIGNQIFVANQASNTVSQIDTRTNTVVATHNVAPAPTFIQANIKNGHEVVVLSLGAGKIDSAEKTAPVATFIDSARFILATTVLDNIEYGGVEAFPNSMVASNKEWAFISVQKGVIRLDIRDRILSTLVFDQEYSKIFYNFRREELLLLKNTEGAIADGDGIIKNLTFTLPTASTTIIGL